MWDATFLQQLMFQVERASNCVVCPPCSIRQPAARCLFTTARSPITRRCASSGRTPARAQEPPASGMAHWRPSCLTSCTLTSPSPRCRSRSKLWFYRHTVWGRNTGKVGTIFVCSLSFWLFLHFGALTQCIHNECRAVMSAFQPLTSVRPCIQYQWNLWIKQKRRLK